MTLPPLDNFDVVGVDGPTYKVGSICCNPTCGRYSDHAHHLFRRSRQGNWAWVRLPDGTVTGNLVPLCYRCHEGITGAVGGHKYAIRWHGGRYWWADVAEGGAHPIYHIVAPLSWQPLRPGEDEDSAHEECPTCGHVKRKPRPKEKARKRKTWTVQVPADSEDGATVLDDYVDALVPVFRLNPDGGVMTRYHTLTRALAFTLVNRDSIPEEGKVKDWIT